MIGYNFSITIDVNGDIYSEDILHPAQGELNCVLLQSVFSKMLHKLCDRISAKYPQDDKWVEIPTDLSSVGRHVADDQT